MYVCVCVYNSVATIKSGHENKKAPQVDIHVCVRVCVCQLLTSA